MRSRVLEFLPSRISSRLSAGYLASYSKRFATSGPSPATKPSSQHQYQKPSPKAPPPGSARPSSDTRRKKPVPKRARTPPKMDNFFFQNMPMPPVFPGQAPPPLPIPGFPTLPFNPFATGQPPFPNVGSSMPFPPPLPFQEQQQSQSQLKGAAQDDSSASNAPNKKAKRKAAKGIKRKSAKQKMAAQAQAQAQAQGPQTQAGHGRGFQPQGAQGQNQVRNQVAQEKIPSATANGPHRDPVVPPSAESGGTPDPHPTYLAHAALPPTRLSAPRTILIVMDLNGTLLFRPDRRKSHNFVQRPHAGPFMEYCIDVFRVAVWSSARPQNVAIMCEQLLGPERRSNLVASWGRDRFGLSPRDYNSRVQCYKRLQSVWADPAIQASHPEAATGGRWDQSNTVLVDDSAEKARTEPHNLLRIPEFGGDAVEATDVLPQVHDYLNELSWQSDISRFIRLNPFRLNPEYRLPAQVADGSSAGQ